MYELHPAPAPPLSRDEYGDFLRVEWPLRLDSASNEKTVQSFLEEHPCLLPGGEGGSDSLGGHHGPTPAAVVAEPELPGLRRLRPDFLWITKTSAALHPVLIEIEDPSKRWFNGRGDPSADLTQARGQLSRWKSWFGQSGHVQLFNDRYVLDPFLVRALPLAPKYILIYGRRSETNSKPKANRRRVDDRPSGVTEMTFDRLVPNHHAMNCVSVAVTTENWKVKHVPPTFRIGPSNAPDLLHFDGWENAISISSMMPETRKEFLLSRLDYWRDYARGPKGIVTAGDFE